jgi:hypothetical protein
VCYGLDYEEDAQKEEPEWEASSNEALRRDRELLGIVSREHMLLAFATATTSYGKTVVLNVKDAERVTSEKTKRLRGLLVLLGRKDLRRGPTFLVLIHAENASPVPELQVFIGVEQRKLEPHV